MSLTIRSAQTINNGVKLRGNNTQYVLPIDPLSRLFELDASTYTSGTILTDISGQGHDAVIHGSPAWNSEAGGCFVFDNDFTKYIDVPGSETGWGLNTAVNNPSAGFSVWAKIIYSGNFQHIAGWRGGLNFWFLLLSGQTNTEARFDGNVGVHDINVDYSSYFNTWTNVTFVVDSALSRTILYINGSSVGSVNGITGSFGSGNSLFRLGCDTNNNFAMSGRIGGSVAYGRALTDAEVLSEFNRTKTRYGL